MNKLFSLFFLLITTTATAQTPAPRHYNFTHYTENSGLLSYQIRSVIQDEEGYIWIAANDGLQRFDGIRYKSFRYTNGAKGTMPSRGIIQLIFDKNKNLWFLTQDGKAGIFNTKTFQFGTVGIKIKNETAFVSINQFKKIITDEEGNIMLLLPGMELLTYNATKNEFSSEYNFITPPPGYFITDIIQQPGTAKYWMGLSGMGLAVYNKSTNIISHAANNTGNEKAIEVVKATPNINRLFIDNKQRLWVAEKKEAGAVISCFDMKKQEIVLLQYPVTYTDKTTISVTNILQQQDGSVWISGIHVLAKYLEKEKQFEQVYNGYADDRSITYVRITCIYEDRENSLWVGTANNGLFRFNPSQEYFLNVWHINPYTGKESDNSPLSYIHLKNGDILAGINNEPLIHYDAGFNVLPFPLKGLNKENTKTVTSMCASPGGSTIWMCTPNAVIKYNQDNNEAKFFPAANVNTRFTQIVEDKNGMVWLGTENNGLYKFNTHTNNSAENFQPATAFSSSIKINKLLIDKKGDLWVGSNDEGVYVLNAVTEKILLHLHTNATARLQLPEQAVVTMLEYNDSLMLIGTNSNVVFYNPLQQKILYSSPAERVIGNISSMEKDAGDYVWVSSTSGIQRVTVTSKMFIKFNREDGIRNDHFLSNASHVLPDGRILYGATNITVVFQPATIKINTGYPAVKISDLKVMNRSLRVDSILSLKTLELSSNENSIAIDLSTVSFATGYAIKYKMEGLDEEWKFTNGAQPLTYTYLPPGNYTLMASSIDADGKQNQPLLQLHIKINPPFYKTWWFYSLLVLLAGAILFMIDRERMQRKESLQKMRSNIAGNLHEEVNTALGNINILSEMARIKADKEPEKSKEFIEQIHSKSHNMIIAMDDMLWSINPDNDSMGKTIERMKEYIAALNNRHGLNIEMIVDKRVEKLELNMQMRHESFILFKETIKTMAQAWAKNCQVHLGLDKEKLIFTIQVQNNCCDIKELTSLFQRRDLEERIKAIHAEFTADVHKTVSVFLLRIPV